MRDSVEVDDSFSELRPHSAEHAKQRPANALQAVSILTPNTVSNTKAVGRSGHCT